MNKKDLLAINNGSPYKISPFVRWPMYDDTELTQVKEVIESQNWWRMSGSKVDEFEEKFAEYHGSKYCLGVTNGTHAIELAIAALELHNDDEVIVPAFTFISTATPPILANAKTVPVDVDPVSFCMLPEAFENAITEKTKVVIPVHMAGHACDMERICEIANRHGIRLIEDAAHAHGAEYKNKKLGTFGDIAIYSFQSGKLMTCGEGGALVTQSKELYDKAFLIHGVGRPKYDKVYKHLELGSNYRMSELHAAVLLAQLIRLRKQSELRIENAALLDGMLKSIDGIVPKGNYEYATFNPQYMYMFYYSSDSFGGLNRNEFVETLNSEGVPAFIAYPRVTQTEFFLNKKFRGYTNADIDIDSLELTNSKRIEEEVVWLPHFTLLGTHKDLEDIAGAIKKIQDAYK